MSPDNVNSKKYFERGKMYVTEEGRRQAVLSFLARVVF
jgi:hypothetical protein